MQNESTHLEAYNCLLEECKRSPELNSILLETNIFIKSDRSYGSLREVLIELAKRIPIKECPLLLGVHPLIDEIVEKRIK